MTQPKQDTAERPVAGRILAVLAVAAAMATLLAACGNSGSGSGPDPADSVGADGSQATKADDVEGPILVFAAASLTDAFADLAREFEARHPGIEVRLNLAGSSALREQILDGAPADVFAAADPSIMAEIEQAGETGAEAVTFARNRLRIAVPSGNPGSVTGVDGLRRPRPAPRTVRRGRPVWRSGPRRPGGRRGRAGSRHHRARRPSPPDQDRGRRTRWRHRLRHRRGPGRGPGRGHRPPAGGLSRGRGPLPHRPTGLGSQSERGGGLRGLRAVGRGAGLLADHGFGAP